MATGGGGTNEPVDKFECGVCLDNFHRPKILPCSHTFCQSCLQNLAGTSTSLDCPSCRKHTPLPPGGVAALQTNFYIEEESNGTVSRGLCKVTRHEGHPVSDLSDKRAKAKVKVQDLSTEVTQQMKEVDHLIAAVNERCDELQQQGQKMEQDCQDRADTLHEWVNDTCTKAVARIQSATQLLTEPLQNIAEELQKKNEALEARQDNMMRVLKGDEDADIVSLEAQLTKCQLNSIDLTQVRKEARDMPVLDVRHNPTAVNLQQLSSFVGVMGPVKQQPQAEDSALAGIAVNKRSSDQPGAACRSVVTTEKKSPHEIVYCRNTKSRLFGMSAISNGRLWVNYIADTHLDAEVVMKLLDSEGFVLSTPNAERRSGALFTITGDVVLSLGHVQGTVDLIQPDGRMHTHLIGASRVVSQAGNNALYLKQHGKPEWRQIRFAVEGELTHVETGKMFLCSEEYLQHVSAKGEYCAHIKTGIAAILKIDSTQNCSLVSQYRAGRYVTDLCFCTINGVEVLLVAGRGEDNVHMVDHTDRARFLGYLATGSAILNNPCLLTTDSEGRLWIGCHGGSVVLVHL